MHLRHILIILAGLTLSSLILLAPASIARAEEPGEVIKAEASYEFGKILYFSLVVKSSQEVISGVVKFNEASLDSEGVAPLQVTEVEPGVYELETAIDLRSLAFRAFSLIHYAFEYTLADGSTVPTGDYALAYSDDRFEWQQTGPGPVRISWYTGDEVQAGRLLLITQQSLASIDKLLDLEAPANLDIYIYNSLDDQRLALPPSGQDWTGGYVDAVHGLLLVALPAGPEQALQAEQQLPHELMHLVLSRQASRPMSPFPAWLEEGLAASVEFFPNADYAFVLQQAIKNGSLLEFPGLCAELPLDPASSTLAYAQSASFVQYLIKEYQSAGLRRLVAAYSSGQDCETGIQTALGSSLRSLERQWRSQELGENTTKATATRLGPWLLILCAILLLPLLGIMISSRQRRKEEQMD